MSNTLPIAITRLLEHISIINQFENFDPYDHYAAWWVTLTFLVSIFLLNDSVLTPLLTANGHWFTQGSTFKASCTYL